ncbi:nucleoside-triphosphatase THEP1 [Drosophila sulfurigaster albostrigata]|uniref:nucleoside-triphosphatase THEP1 n=1 Tax=Drosophila sulfurigaster albostrigata TaxID=89887 RepID=UPI002D21BA62|nr:nucleoside-triphosphatase THEP1 [Drosophila sulfurigaster albostrigata]
MEKHKLTVFLITGQPGIGKTTLVGKIAAKMRNQCTLQGFFTDEVRENNQRIGFDVVTMSGKREILAREKVRGNLPKVGKYSVYVENFEKLALPLLTISSRPTQLMIIDEVGKMELLSKRFEEAVRMLVLYEQIALITIPLHTNKRIGLVEFLKSYPQSRIYTVNHTNRDSLVRTISEDIIKSIPKI